MLATMMPPTITAVSHFKSSPIVNSLEMYNGMLGGSSAGPSAAEDLEAYFREYYPNVLPGQVEQLLAAVRTVTPEAIRDTIKRFEDIGCDEFIFVPTTPDIVHLDGLAEIVFG